MKIIGIIKIIRISSSRFAGDNDPGPVCGGGPGLQASGADGRPATWSGSSDMPSQTLCQCDPATTLSDLPSQARTNLTFSSTPTRSAHCHDSAPLKKKRCLCRVTWENNKKKEKRSFHIHFNLADFSHHSESNQGHSDFWCLYYSQMLCQLSYGEPRMWWLRQEWTDIYTVGYKSAQAKPWHLHASEIKTENMEDKLPAVHQLSRYVPVESTSNSIQVVKRDLEPA